MAKKPFIVEKDFKVGNVSIIDSDGRWVGSTSGIGGHTGHSGPTGATGHSGAVGAQGVIGNTGSGGVASVGKSDAPVS